MLIILQQERSQKRLTCRLQARMNRQPMGQLELLLSYERRAREWVMDDDVTYAVKSSRSGFCCSFSRSPSIPDTHATRIATYIITANDNDKQCPNYFSKQMHLFRLCNCTPTPKICICIHLCNHLERIWSDATSSICSRTKPPGIRISFDRCDQTNIIKAWKRHSNNDFKRKSTSGF